MNCQAGTFCSSLTRDCGFRTDHPKSSMRSVAQGMQGCKISLFHTLLRGGACCLNEVIRHPSVQKGQREPMNGLVKAMLGTCLSQERGAS